MRACGWIMALCATVAVATAEAQIRLIPQSKIDSVRSVATTDVGMRFESGTTVDFGEIAEDGGLWRGSVEWQNGSDNTLTITRVTASCGCLSAKYDRATVAVGERGELRLTYDPRGHAGEVSQRIFVYTDRSDGRPAAVLTVRGRVRAAADPSGHYPHARGALLLRQTWVRFSGEEVQRERIACMNGGRKPLKITADTLLTSPEIEVHTEPEVLEPGTVGDLVITYTPSQKQPTNSLGAPRMMRPRLFLSGVEVAPRERAIEVFVARDEMQK